jgi:hypothetical protein
VDARGLRAQTALVTNPYAVPLAALERDAHVPVEDMVTEQAEAPAEPPVSAEDLATLRLLGITGAGVLRA